MLLSLLLSALIALNASAASPPGPAACDAIHGGVLLGPSAVDVTSLPRSGDHVTLTLRTTPLELSPAATHVLLLSVESGPWQAVDAEWAEQRVSVRLPPGLARGSALSFRLASHAAGCGHATLSDPLPVAFTAAASAVSVSGERRVWHRLTLDVTGPAVGEQDLANPFLDHRFDVTFVHADTLTTHTVPGFFAADGDAAETSADSGDVWRAHFAPDLVGTWHWSASFRSGTDVAVSDDPSAGVPDPLIDGLTGTFVVQATDKTGVDFRARGRLVHEGEHYLRHAGTGEPFLKVGVNSPENLLAYADIDASTPTHAYAPHLGDWQPGDPSWKGGLGKGLIGAINYLSSKGLNASFFLTFNVGGDSGDVWPFTSEVETRRFDVSKLAQWEIVFTHMDRRGILQSFTFTEEEASALLGAADSTERRLYAREMVARFGHHLGLIWNPCEEIGIGTADILEQVGRLKDLDTYDHPVVIHTFPLEQHLVYPPLLPDERVAGASLQSGMQQFVHDQVVQWHDASDAPGAAHSWIVTSDESGYWVTGVCPDGTPADPNHDDSRGWVLWGTLMGGGFGIEWYFGIAYPNGDLDCEDFRTRDLLFEQTRHALEFFEQHVPYTGMQPADELIVAGGSYGFAKAGEVYLFYDRNDGADTPMVVSLDSGAYRLRWFDPELGGPLQDGSVTVVAGGARVRLGQPPFSGDAAALLERLPIGPGQPVLRAEGEAGALGVSPPPK